MQEPKPPSSTWCLRLEFPFCPVAHVFLADQANGDMPYSILRNAAYVGLDQISFSIDPDDDWQLLPLSSTYQVFTGTPLWQAPQYMVSATNRVYLRGLVTKRTGNVAVGDIVATLPSSWGPDHIPLCPSANVSS